jgi:hypothetical protein
MADNRQGLMVTFGGVFTRLAAVTISPSTLRVERLREVREDGRAGHCYWHPATPSNFSGHWDRPPAMFRVDLRVPRAIL